MSSISNTSKFIRKKTTKKNLNKNLKGNKDGDCEQQLATIDCLPLVIKDEILIRVAMSSPVDLCRCRLRYNKFYHVIYIVID